MAARTIPACIILAALAAAPAYAQLDAGEGPTTEDLTILFGVSIMFVTGVILYITRDIIRRKKTEYDGGKYESQRNRDYEKYHSDWSEYATTGERRARDGAARAGSPQPDHYKTLGLERGASGAEIKKRYRELARKTHPDRTGKASSKDEMAEINNAYDVLSDPDRRKKYDASLDIS